MKSIRPVRKVLHRLTGVPKTYLVLISFPLNNESECLLLSLFRPSNNNSNSWIVYLASRHHVRAMQVSSLQAGLFTASRV